MTSIPVRYPVGYFFVGLLLLLTPSGGGKLLLLTEAGGGMVRDEGVLLVMRFFDD